MLSLNLSKSQLHYSLLHAIRRCYGYEYLLVTSTFRVPPCPLMCLALVLHALLHFIFYFPAACYVTSNSVQGRRRKADTNGNEKDGVSAIHSLFEVPLFAAGNYQT